MRDNGAMQSWPDRRLLDLLNLEIPIIQAPMAGADSAALARSVSATGALGSFACALLSPDGVREATHALREGWIAHSTSTSSATLWQFPIMSPTRDGRTS